MKLSSRVRHDSGPNRLSEILAEKRRAGERLLDLTESNPTRAGIVYPEGFLAALSDPAVLRYEPEPFGLPAARERIAAEYGMPFDHVAMTASTSEAYSWIFKLLCDPGDEVLVPRPSYPLFEYLAALENVRVRPYPLFYDHGWFIDFHALEQAITDRTRAVVVVNPNNPTGHFIRRHELAQLVEIRDRYDLAILSDEVFAGYQIDPAPDSVLTLRGVADFALDGLSKLAGLPQMKLAWMLMRRPVPQLEIIADTYLSAGTPVQTALGAMLGLREPVRRQILDRARASLTLLDRKLVVEAGWYAVVPVLDEEETAERLLVEHNVVVQPGYFYDFEKSGYLVLSLLTPPDVFAQGVSAINATR
jgi:aspartate/methionine/tyrosine aminotransferase